MNVKAPLHQQFKNISTMVHQQLNMIIDQRAAERNHDQDSDSDESLNIKELINDFATDEFVTKNVRVRPTSSYSQAGKDQSEVGVRGAGGRDEEEDEKKFNSETNYELSQQRFEQKERKKKEELERLLELEKAEKKKKQKA